MAKKKIQKKRGRPRSADPRSKILFARLTETEMDEVTSAATKAGVDRSTYVRDAVLRAAG